MAKNRKCDFIEIKIRGDDSEMEKIITKHNANSIAQRVSLNYEGISS